MAAAGRTERGVVAAGWLFYVLVAFEFFYMASPFAAYFYGAYGPGLDALAGYPALSWLLTFFAPHIVAETRSPLINLHNAVGLTLFLGGLGVFLAGVVHIYANKLRR